MGTKGYLDDIEVEDVLRFERGLLDHLHANSTVLDTIAATGDLSSETEEALKNAVEEFHHQWISAGRGAAGLEDGEVVAERTREETRAVARARRPNRWADSRGSTSSASPRRRRSRRSSAPWEMIAASRIGAARRAATEAGPYEKALTQGGRGGRGSTRTSTTR